MTYETIDLYEYFKQTRPSGGKGYLRCMTLSPIEEKVPERRYPAVLIMPGGAYRRVSEREAEPVAFGYMRHGYSAFILDYSVAPICWPTAFREAVMAILYIRERAQKYAIDPQKVTAIGFSAGGHLCGCLATLTDEKLLEDLTEGRKFSPKPDAVILSYPVITSGDSAHKFSIKNISGGDRRIAKKLSLEERVNSDSVPAFIWHTREDATVPVANSLLLAAAYDRAGVPFALHIFEKGEHGMSTADCVTYHSDSVPAHSTDMPRWLDMSVNWLRDRGVYIKDAPQKKAKN